MNTLAWKPLSEIDMRPIVFLDKPVWQEAAFHLLVGRKNSGKGTYLAGEDGSRHPRRARRPQEGHVDRVR